MEKHEEALVNLNKSLEIDPSDAWGLSIRG